MKLSIILPCYNVEKTLARALESILMQNVNFDYEIIIVDDASTDNTIEIANKYKKKYKKIRIIYNKINKGNAFTFYTGLKAAEGEYFCVLDGDDYYTIPDKLQRQIDFFDLDQKEEYVAVATQFIIDLGNGMVSVPDRSSYTEFSYADFLTQHSGYYHTATYMYRNIFRGNVPEFLGDILYRGDTPRTTFHLMYSGKKVKILDFIGSAYTFEFEGIWSSLNQKQQFEYQINYQEQHKKNVTTKFEQDAADKLIAYNQKKLESAKDDLRRYPAITIDQALFSAKKYANRFAFEQRDFVLKHAYYSSYIDTLCASLGYIYDVHNVDYVSQDTNFDNICIINGVLNPHGGGIFAEIGELIDIFKSKSIYLLVTNMQEVSKEIEEELLNKHCNLTILCPPKETLSPLGWLKEKIKSIAPYRCYYYCSHNDTYGVALAQQGLCENIALFSFDHGYLCGISNANLNYIIAKRPVDYWMLRKNFADKVLFIPTWSKEAKNCERNRYEAFKTHTALITASGAARFYKIDGLPPERYIDMILSLLQKTGGLHYHFGELPEKIKEEVKDKLLLLEIPSERFVHIPWSENIPHDFLEKEIDIFIEPFPVVSYKLTLEILSVGIPIIVHQGLNRMNIADFVPKGTLVWKNSEEFYDLLISLTKDQLELMSIEARQYFETYHSEKKIAQLLYENKGIVLKEKIRYPDDTIMDITFSLRLFDNNMRISIVNNIIDKINIQNIKQDVEEQANIQNNDEYINEAACKKIKEIRSSRRFKLGFILSFPLRFIKQKIIYVHKYGLHNGSIKLKEDKILSYYRESEEEELKVLLGSTAYRWGEYIAKIYRVIKNSLFKR